MPLPRTAEHARRGHGARERVGIRARTGFGRTAAAGRQRSRAVVAQHDAVASVHQHLGLAAGGKHETHVQARVTERDATDERRVRVAHVHERVVARSDREPRRIARVDLGVDELPRVRAFPQVERVAVGQPQPTLRLVLARRRRRRDARDRRRAQGSLGELVDRVRELIVQQRLPRRGDEPADDHARAVSRFDRRDDPQGAPIGRHVDARDRNDAVDALGRSVLPPPVVVVLRDRDVVGRHGRADRQRFGQLDREPVLLQAHVAHLEGRATGPAHARDPVPRRESAPTAVRETEEQRSVRCEQTADRGADVATNDHHGALVLAADLLEVGAHHEPVRELRQDQLILVGPERAVPRRGAHVAGRARPTVRDPTRGRRARHVDGVREARLGPGLLVRVGPHERRRCAVEPPFAHVFQRTHGHPVALVVGDEQVPQRIRADAARRAEAARERRQRAVRGDLHDPATPRRERASVPPLGFGEPQVERDVEVPLRVARQAERELVVVARDTPRVADRVDRVAATVVIGVAQARQLGALQDVHVVALHGETEPFLQSLAEQAEARVARVLRERILDDPHLSAARARDESSVGEESEAADFQDGPVRRLESIDGVVGGFTRRRDHRRRVRSALREGDEHGVDQGHW